MSMPARPADPVTPAPPDPGLLLLGPLTAMRAWVDMSRTVSSALPASLLIAASPFFWAPPLWVGALMAGRSAAPGPDAVSRPRRAAGDAAG